MDIVDVLDTNDDFIMTYNGQLLVDKRIFIQFKNENDFLFNFSVYRLDGKWHPAVVFHDSKCLEKDRVCPACDTSFAVCNFFRDSLDELLEDAMSHPKLRVKKIFL